MRANCQFRSYLHSANYKFTLRTDHKSLVWQQRFKDTEGMMARWLHTLQQFQFSIVHRAGSDHGNADGLSRAPLLLVDSVPVLTAPRWIRPWWLLINPLMLYLWETRRIPTSFPYSPVKIGWYSWTMICRDWPLSPVRVSVSPLYSLQTIRVSRYWSGSGLILSPLDGGKVIMPGTAIFVAS